MYTRDYASVDPNEFAASGDNIDHLDRYKSVHANQFTNEKIENMDEDDLPDEDDNRGTFLQELNAHFEEDDLPMPGRGERTAAFNDDLEIGEIRLKG